MIEFIITNRLTRICTSGRLTRENVQDLMGKIMERAHGHFEQEPLFKLLGLVEGASLCSQVSVYTVSHQPIVIARAHVFTNAHKCTKLCRLCMKRPCVSSCAPKTSKEQTT